MENWRPVVGFESSYEVSDRGAVRSLDRRVRSGGDGRTRLSRGRVLSASKESRDRGHLSVQLWDGNKSTRRAVHHLVLEAFVGPCPPGLEALHHDDNGSNNVLANLRWGTRSENIADRLRNGRRCNKTRTHCKRGGHEFTEQTTKILSNGKRTCLVCLREYQRRWKRERKLA